MAYNFDEMTEEDLLAVLASGKIHSVGLLTKLQKAERNNVMPREAVLVAIDAALAYARLTPRGRAAAQKAKAEPAPAKSKSKSRASKSKAPKSKKAKAASKAPKAEEAPIRVLSLNQGYIVVRGEERIGPVYANRIQAELAASKE